MRDPNKAVQALRERKTVRDPATGLELCKPAPSPMRQVPKGGWVHRAVPIQPSQTPDSRGARPAMTGSVALSANICLRKVTHERDLGTPSCT